VTRTPLSMSKGQRLRSQKRGILRRPPTQLVFFKFNFTMFISCWTNKISLLVCLSVCLYPCLSVRLSPLSPPSVDRTLRNSTTYQCERQIGCGRATPGDLFCRCSFARRSPDGAVVARQLPADVRFSTRRYVSRRRRYFYLGDDLFYCRLNALCAVFELLTRRAVGIGCIYSRPRQRAY